MATQTAVPLLDLQAQFAAIRDEILAAVEEVFASQRFILEPKVIECEEQVAAYCRRRYSVCVSSGTDALQVYPELTDEQADYVIESLVQFLNHNEQT